MASVEPIDEKQTLLSDSDLVTESDVEPDSEIDENYEVITKQDGAPVQTANEPQPDLRFHPPPPSPFKRAALIVFTLLLFWLALTIRKSLWKNNHEAKVIYASRYSKEHRFRPAASPVITETLKDGRVRIRGAGPTSTVEPVPTTPIPKKKKTNKKVKARKGKALGNKDRKARQGK